jgi:hypothetical protein
MQAGISRYRARALAASRHERKRLYRTEAGKAASKTDIDLDNIAAEAQ